MLLFFCKYYFVFGGIRRSGLCQKFLHHCMPRAYFHFFKLSYSDILYDVLLCLITISGAALPKNLNKRVFILTNQSDPTHGDAALQRAAKTRAGGCQCMCSCIRFWSNFLITSILFVSDPRIYWTMTVLLNSTSLTDLMLVLIYPCFIRLYHYLYSRTYNILYLFNPHLLFLLRRTLSSSIITNRNIIVECLIYLILSTVYFTRWRTRGSGPIAFRWHGEASTNDGCYGSQSVC